MAFRRILQCAAGALVLAAPAAFADTGSLYVKAGTLGVGAGYAIPIGDSFAARIGANVFRVSTDHSYDGNAYSAKVKFGSGELLGDWYFTDGFRLTIGALYNRNRLDLDAKLGPGGTYQVNGVEYPINSASAVVDLGHRRITPYTGVGYSTKPSLAAGLGFYADVGAMYQKPRSTISVDANPAILNDPTFQADKAQAESDLSDSVSHAKVYPVISVGMIYGF
jgi:hypothetical protein